MYVKYCPDNRFATALSKLNSVRWMDKFCHRYLILIIVLSQQSFITLCLNEALFYVLYLFRLLYAIKTWENIKKSTFFQEYGRLLPWTVDDIQPHLISWLQNLVWRKEAVSSVSMETGALQYWWLEKSFQHHECSNTVHEGGLLVIIKR